EQLAQPGAHLGDQELPEGAGLGALPGLETLLQPLADDLQRALRRWVVAPALLQQLLARLGEEQPAPERVSLQRRSGHGLPRTAAWRRNALPLGERPRSLDRHVDEDGLRDDLVHHPELPGLRGADGLPGEDELQPGLAPAD